MTEQTDKIPEGSVPPSESGQEKAPPESPPTPSAAAQEPSAEPGPGAASEGAGAGGSQAVPLAALPASDLLTTFLSLMAMKAWEGMGLVASPMTGKTEKNLEDARLAIDAYAAVFELLRVRVDDGARREMENALTMLRVNFVDKSAG
jgi:hypothetical protein